MQKSITITYEEGLPVTHFLAICRERFEAENPTKSFIIRHNELKQEWLKDAQEAVQQIYRERNSCYFIHFTNPAIMGRIGGILVKLTAILMGVPNISSCPTERIEEAISIQREFYKALFSSLTQQDKACVEWLEDGFYKSTATGKPPRRVNMNNPKLVYRPTLRGYVRTYCQQTAGIKEEAAELISEICRMVLPSAKLEIIPNEKMKARPYYRPRRCAEMKDFFSVALINAIADALINVIKKERKCHE